MLPRWNSTVLIDTFNAVASSFDDLPSATSCRTSRWRAVSGDTVPFNLFGLSRGSDVEKAKDRKVVEGQFLAALPSRQMSRSGRVTLHTYFTVR